MGLCFLLSWYNYFLVLIGLCYIYILKKLVKIKYYFLFSDFIIIILFYFLDNFTIGLRRSLSFYAPFHLSKIYSDIATISGYHLSVNDGMWIGGSKFTYDDLFAKHDGKMYVMGEEVGYSTPTVFESFLSMLGTCLLYYLITWYADHVIIYL